MGQARPFDYAILVVGIIAVSTAAILIREADAPTRTIAAYRLVLASLPMVAFTLWRREDIVPRGQARTALTLAAGLFLALHFLFWVESVKETSIVTSVVLVTTAPLFVAIGSGPLLGERPDRRVWYGLAITVAGTVVMVAEDFGEGGDTVRGDAFALLGAVFAAGFMLAGRRVLLGGARWLPYSTGTYIVAAVFLIAAVALGGDALTGFTAETYVYLVLLALLPQMIGHTAINRSLGLLPAFVVALAVQAEPVGSTILAAGLLSEFPTALELIGGVMVLAGVYLGLRPGRRRAVALSSNAPSP